jgi:hypothetical protein
MAGREFTLKRLREGYCAQEGDKHAPLSGGQTHENAPTMRIVRR